MKKEFSVYAALLIGILALSSFEYTVRPGPDQLQFSSFKTRDIYSLSVDIPANVFVTSGSESRVIVEGSSTLLKLIELSNHAGHLSLQSESGNNLLQHAMTYLWSRQPVNVYITAENFERIRFSDNNGATLKSVLYNGDRAMIEVEDDGLINMIKASRERKKCEQVVMCASNDTHITANCL